MNERKAKTESTRTGSSGSRIPEITQCNALEKLFWSEKLMWAYCPATHAAYTEDETLRNKLEKLWYPLKAIWMVQHCLTNTGCVVKATPER